MTGISSINPTNNHQHSQPAAAAGFVLASTAVAPLPGGVITGEIINQAVNGSSQAAAAIRNALQAGGSFAPNALGVAAGVGINLVIHAIFPPGVNNGDAYLAGSRLAEQLAAAHPDQIRVMRDQTGMVTSVINNLTGLEIMRNNTAGLRISVPLPFDGRESPLPPALRGNLNLTQSPPAPTAPAPNPAAAEPDFGNYDPSRNPATPASPFPGMAGMGQNAQFTDVEPTGLT